jgi:4-diphosphocytidyl-2-C-methyl-D-erythritol kinase
MVSIDLADTLEIGEGDRLEVEGVATERIDTGDGNLVRRALGLVGRTASVRLTKRIPTGGGLGGGSADAAAILRWAGFDDLDAAAGLGGDVPFCLVGGRALVTGIGEKVEPLPFVERTFTLLTPPFGVDTAEVYRCWDELGGPHGPGGNDLELAAMAVEPGLDDFRVRLADATGQRPCLAGSGATWFVEGEYPGDDRVVVRTVTARS